MRSTDIVKEESQERWPEEVRTDPKGANKIQEGLSPPLMAPGRERQAANAFDCLRAVQVDCYLSCLHFPF